MTHIVCLHYEQMKCGICVYRKTGLPNLIIEAEINMQSPNYFGFLFFKS